MPDQICTAQQDLSRESSFAFAPSEGGTMGSAISVTAPLITKAPTSKMKVSMSGNIRNVQCSRVGIGI